MEFGILLLFAAEPKYNLNYINFKKEAGKSETKKMLQSYITDLNYVSLLFGDSLFLRHNKYNFDIPNHKMQMHIFKNYISAKCFISQT